MPVSHSIGSPATIARRTTRGTLHPAERKINRANGRGCKRIMDREQRNILENYRRAMRYEFSSLERSGLTTDNVLTSLQRLSKLALNAAGLIGNIEIQQRMEI
jgi:hypothetical protein